VNVRELNVTGLTSNPPAPPATNVDVSAWERCYARVTGKQAVGIVVQHDSSADCAVDVAYVFKLDGNTYAYVHQSGCSCWTPCEDDVEYVGTRLFALAKFEEFLECSGVALDRRFEIMRNVKYSDGGDENGQG